MKNLLVDLSLVLNSLSYFKDKRKKNPLEEDILMNGLSSSDDDLEEGIHYQKQKMNISKMQEEEKEENF